MEKRILQGLLGQALLKQETDPRGRLAHCLTPSHAVMSGSAFIEIACIDQFCFSLWPCCPTDNTKICVAFNNQHLIFTHEIMGWLWFCWIQVGLPGSVCRLSSDYSMYHLFWVQ